MRNIMLTIEYDGTAYCGWQVQPNGVSIQEVMECALEKMTGEPARLLSSGRTDAGVHALGMVASFRTSRNLPLTAFSDGLNSLLPRDISVKAAAEVPLVFHPRADAREKLYRYTILNTPRRSPLNRFYAWHLRSPLDVERMIEAAALFVGEHDFAAFRSSGCGARTSVRTVFAVDVYRRQEFVEIDVRGSGFLKNMVRIMVGTLVEVGQGKFPPAGVASLIAGRSRPDAGATAPPHGLCLVEVRY